MIRSVEAKPEKMKTCSPKPAKYAALERTGTPCLYPQPIKPVDSTKITSKQALRRREKNTPCPSADTRESSSSISMRGLLVVVNAFQAEIITFIDSSYSGKNY